MDVGSTIPLNSGDSTYFYSDPKYHVNRQLPLAQCFEQGFLVLFSFNADDVHADMVWRIECGPDQPASGWHLRLLSHGPDLCCVVVNIFNNIVYKFHTFLLIIVTTNPNKRDRY